MWRCLKQGGCMLYNQRSIIHKLHILPVSSAGKFSEEITPFIISVFQEVFLLKRYTGNLNILHPFQEDPEQFENRLVLTIGRRPDMI